MAQTTTNNRMSKFIFKSFIKSAPTLGQLIFCNKFIKFIVSYTIFNCKHFVLCTIWNKACVNFLPKMFYETGCFIFLWLKP